MKNRLNESPIQSAKVRSLLTRVGKLLSISLFVATVVPLAELDAHTPYGQWDSFRMRHLQIVTSREDLAADAKADQWVAVLAEHLPKSKAVVSRARNLAGIASLLKTDQAKVAVLSYEHAKSMFEGSSPFEDFYPMPLQLLINDDKFVLVTRDDLPEEHGFLVVATLLEHASDLQVSVPADGLLGVSAHPGAIAAALEH